MEGQYGWRGRCGLEERIEGGVFGALGPKMLARQQGGLDCTRNARQEKVSEFLKWREFGLPVEISKKHRFFSAKKKKKNWFGFTLGLLP